MNLPICTLLFVSLFAGSEQLNDRPIIGVITQGHDTEKNEAFIASPYVKFLEMAGARIVPILLNQKDHYYEKMTDSCNGFLFPGGGRNIDSSPYRTTTEKLFDLAMEANDRGDYFPIWGECQGFQILTILWTKKYLHRPNPVSDNWLSMCESVDRPLPLDFVGDPRTSRMFANASDEILDILRKEPVTANYHHWCITPENMTKSGLINELRMISTNKDDHGKVFVSTYESFNPRRPVYALQWHPEKVNFEFKLAPDHLHVPHTYHANLMVQYLANFFVNEARKSNHKFHDDGEEYVIYHKQPEFHPEANHSRGRDDGEYFSQMYFFKRK